MLKASELFPDEEERSLIKYIIDLFDGRITKIIDKNGDNILDYIIDNNRR